jgi:hypothetical protein
VAIGVLECMQKEVNEGEDDGKATVVGLGVEGRRTNLGRKVRATHVSCRIFSTSADSTASVATSN